MSQNSNPNESSSRLKKRAKSDFGARISTFKFYPTVTYTCIPYYSFLILDSKLKSQNALLNPDKKTIMSQNDKNIKSDRNIHKLHSTVKKKEINISTYLFLK